MKNYRSVERFRQYLYAEISKEEIIENVTQYSVSFSMRGQYYGQSITFWIGRCNKIVTITCSTEDTKSIIKIISDKLFKRLRFIKMLEVNAELGNYRHTEVSDVSTIWHGFREKDIPTTIRSAIQFYRTSLTVYDSKLIMPAIKDTNIIGLAFMYASRQSSTAVWLQPPSELVYSILKKMLIRRNWDTPEIAQNWIDAIY